MPLPVRRVVTTGAVVIGLTIAVFAGVSVLHALIPPVSQATATTLALNQLRQMNSSLNGYVLVSARYDPAPEKEYDDYGNVIYSESGWSCHKLGLHLPDQLCTEHAAWVLHFRAPAQGGFKNWDAYVLVNATTGNVGSASIDGR